METSSASTLPEYAVKMFHIDEPAGAYDMLEIRCPRKDCQSSFWVGLAWRVLQPVEGASGTAPARPFGRPCPVCSRVAAIPEDWRRGEAPVPRRVKIKKRA